MRATILALAILVAGPVALAQEIGFFRIGTAGTGGTYYPVGSLIAEAISAPPGSKPCDPQRRCGVPGLVASAVGTEGSVANALAIQHGRLESGFVQGDIANWAYRGTGPWTQPAATRLRAIANLYPETLHLIAREGSGIDAVSDLRGKRVSLDEPDSGTRVDAELVLGAAGLNVADLSAQYLSVERAAEAMRAGQLDAFFFIGGHPAAAISELASQSQIRVIAIDGRLAQKILSAYPFFSSGLLLAGTYAGQDKPVPTLTVGAQWLVSADQPEALVHDITATLWNDATRKLLEGGPSRARTIRRENALNGLSVPLHPGAERFYREAGLLD